MGIRARRRQPSAALIPLEGPNLPPGYARTDQVARKDDLDYWAFKHGRAVAVRRERYLNPFGTGTPQYFAWAAAFQRGYDAQKAQLAAGLEMQAMKAEGVQYVIQRTVRGHLKRELVRKDGRPEKAERGHP